MAIYTYTVWDDDERYEFVTNGSVDWEIGRLWVAESAAEDFYDNHDGWESSWPIELALYNGETALGRYSVGLEHRPSFYANIMAA